ncbi:hypothetical protein MHEI_12480 [Mycobacterium heidelbergense]|nr:hypothetical protein MHEI_12480 [Mycobacterium heidelbergense]
MAPFPKKGAIVHGCASQPGVHNDVTNTDAARDLTAQCLRKLPGHNGFREFAAEIGATAPT